VIVFIILGRGVPSTENPLTRADVVHPTDGEMVVFNNEKSKADRLADEERYASALEVWDEFVRINPQDYWKSYVEKERGRILEIAVARLQAFLSEAKKFLNAGDTAQAKQSYENVLTSAERIKKVYFAPKIEELLQEARQGFAEVEKAEKTARPPEVSLKEKQMAEWERAQKMIDEDLAKNEFAGARETCQAFLTKEYVSEVSSAARERLEEIDRKEKEYKKRLEAERIEKEKREFENAMKEANNLVTQLRNKTLPRIEASEKIRRLCRAYERHSNEEFRKEAERILSELRELEKEIIEEEVFFEDMKRVHDLMEKKDFDKALEICRKYTDSNRQERKEQVQEKFLKIKKERFLDKNLVYVAGGEFTIGSDNLQDSNPLRKCKMDPFYIGIYEVTNAEYERFIRESGHKPPAHWRNNKPKKGEENHPVTWVSVKDALAYCAWLSKKEGAIYRLPTEAEWEIAASWDGSKKSVYPWGDEFRSSFCNLEGGRLMAVGECRGDRSPVGAFDMGGNVCEWVTTLDGKGYTLCGGCCDDGGEAKAARATFRHKCNEDTIGASIGFRVVREDK
ncbi:MAG: SUMF1/EgtB/PvdO family nonheme iron enzyme, partial [Planctomycetota bacterium]|nr:SUMF1/EgtB/PvdO family nonheme iron enzyme [Planctomycetota bacterium]